MHLKLTSLFKEILLTHADVHRFPNLIRASLLFAQGEKADTLYFIEEGLIKLTRSDGLGGKFILSIYGPNELVGEESLSSGEHLYFGEAEVLSPATVYKIPCGTLDRLKSQYPELGLALVRCLLDSNERFIYKVQLLCLQNVETRILYYLQELAKLVEPAEDLGHQLPITQLELADLVGATRETISTSLKQLEIRGLVKRERRLLTVYLRHQRAASAGGGSDYS